MYSIIILIWFDMIYKYCLNDLYEYYCDIDYSEPKVVIIFEIL